MVQVGNLVKLEDSDSIYSVYKIANDIFTGREFATIFLHKGNIETDKVRLDVYTEFLEKVEV